MANLKQAVKEQFAQIITHYINGGEYQVELVEDYVGLWHKDFNENDMCFIMEAEIYDDTQVCLCAYLYPCDEKHKLACMQALQEVLGVGKECFDASEEYITLSEYEEISLSEFSAKKFYTYFDKVKEKVYSFNQKIQEDLLKQGNSKLKKFITK